MKDLTKFHLLEAGGQFEVPFEEAAVKLDVHSEEPALVLGIGQDGVFQVLDQAGPGSYSKELVVKNAKAVQVVPASEDSSVFARCSVRRYRSSDPVDGQALFVLPAEDYDPMEDVRRQELVRQLMHFGILKEQGDGEDERNLDFFGSMDPDPEPGPGHYEPELSPADFDRMQAENAAAAARQGAEGEPATALEEAANGQPKRDVPDPREGSGEYTEHNQAVQTPGRGAPGSQPHT